MSDTRVLVLVGSLRTDSLNRRIAETLKSQAPEGVTVEIAEGLGRGARSTTRTSTAPTCPPRPPRCAPRSPPPTACSS